MEKYYTYNESSGRLIEAKRFVSGLAVVIGDGKDFAKYLNAYPKAKDDAAPDTPDGKIAVHHGWELIDGAWHKKWIIEDAPPPAPRRWSRLSIKGALADAHIKPAAEAFLSSFEVKPDYTAWEALTDCDYIEEGYGGQEKWNAILNGAAQAFGKTREEIDAFLDKIPTE